MTMLKDVCELLESNGFGIEGTTIFRGQMPNTPDDLIGVFEYSGRSPDKVGNTSMPGLQVRVRSENFDDADSLMKSINDFLSRIGDEQNDGVYSTGVELNGTYYTNFGQAQSGPINLGRDESDRFEMTTNYILSFYRS